MTMPFERLSKKDNDTHFKPWVNHWIEENQVDPDPNILYPVGFLIFRPKGVILECRLFSAFLFKSKAAYKHLTTCKDDRDEDFWEQSQHIKNQAHKEKKIPESAAKYTTPFLAIYLTPSKPNFEIAIQKSWQLYCTSEDGSTIKLHQAVEHKTDGLYFPEPYLVWPELKLKSLRDDDQYPKPTGQLFKTYKPLPITL
jgi:hypothetical protein